MITEEQMRDTINNKEGGLTSLHNAAICGRVDFVNSLIDVGGVNVNQQTDEGQTALLLAAINNHVDVVVALIKQRADINVQDRLGNTALSYATAKNYTKVVELLITARGKD